MSDLVTYRSLLVDSSRWERLELRPGDVVISTPAKCGTTWTQMLCALLIFDGPDLPAPLDALSPWVDQRFRPEGPLLAGLDAQTHRRFLKTHTPLDGLPRRDDVNYVVVGRDPRDAGVSWDHHMANIDFGKIVEALAAAGEDLSEIPPPSPPAPDLAGRLRDWMTEDRSPGGVGTMADLLHHQQVAWDRRHEPAVALFHYADLRRDLVGQMRRLADHLDIDVTDERLAELAPEAGIDRMRDRSDELAPDITASDHWKDRAAFFRLAGSAEWDAVMTDDDRARYADRLGQLIAPDLATWLHAGGPTD